jgi:hypothetical protein
VSVFVRRTINARLYSCHISYILLASATTTLTFWSQLRSLSESDMVPSYIFVPLKYLYVHSFDSLSLLALQQYLFCGLRVVWFMALILVNNDD